MMSKNNFENAMKRLEEIVQDLESGDLSLEESLNVFEEGMRLIKFCSEKLEEVDQRVTMLVKDADGKPVKQPFDFEKREET
jgi:exodeoxyribonuclease VII small subunit